MLVDCCMLGNYIDPEHFYFALFHSFHLHSSLLHSSFLYHYSSFSQIQGHLIFTGQMETFPLHGKLLSFLYLNPVYNQSNPQTNQFINEPFNGALHLEFSVFYFTLAFYLFFSFYLIFIFHFVRCILHISFFIYFLFFNFYFSFSI